MKRLPFLGSVTAAVLTACGHGGSRAIPGVPGASTSGAAPLAGARATAAETIPASVLASPILGEARRYDGTTPPNGAWMLAQGQTLSVTQNRQLFSILGTVGGGDGKTTFKLPKTALGYAIAVGGFFPTSPQALVNFGRHGDGGLGPGARAAMPQLRAPRPQVAAEIAKLPHAVAASAPRWALPDGVAQSRNDAATASARDAALGALSGPNRALTAALCAGLADGSVDVAGATQRVRTSLGASEAAAVLASCDAMFATGRAGWSGAGHADLALEAARFLIAIAPSADQLQALRARG